MKFAISMLGARMHYAVPRIFYQAGVLQRLYTDICADTSWPQALKFLPSRWIGRGARRLLARRVPDVPLDRVTAFTLFGLEYFWRQKVAAKNGELFEAYLWAGREFGRRVIENGFDGADGVYCFTSAALEIMNAAKQLGLYSVLEQSSSAKAIELSLMREEFQARPGWERPPTHGTALEDFISREESEWALADTIVCPSAWVQSGLKARGVPDAKCVVVPYGVDVDWGQTVQTGPTGGRLHSSGNHKLRVLTVGGVRLQKGSHYVLDAARKLKGACDFRMAGSVFVSKSAQSEICKQIQLLGPVPRSEIARHYSWADVFLLPSVCEGSATVTYEAMAHGLPVICTPNTGSVVRNNLDGFIIPARDVNSIVDRLERLRKDLTLRKELSANARLRAAEFTIEAYGRRLLAAIMRT